MTNCFRVQERTGAAFVVVMVAHVRRNINLLINLKGKVRLKYRRKYKVNILAVFSHN